MLPRRCTTTHLILAGLLTAASACGEQPAPTAVSVFVDAPTAAMNGNNAKVKVKSFQLSANTLRIEGPAVTADVTIGNSGVAIQSGVLIRVEIMQGATTRVGAKLLAQCSPALADAGKLPTGNCDMVFNARATNAPPGTGTLVPGSATLVLRVLHVTLAVETELASKSVTVNLIATPSITTLTLAPTMVAIGGPSATYNASLQNPANSLQGVQLQGWFVQGLVRRAAGGTLVSCGSSAGAFPPGTCTMTSPASASNAGAGTGTLVPGPATFELHLIQSSGGGNTTFDVKTVAVTLTVNAPTIVSITPASSFVVLDKPGAFTQYTTAIHNPGAPRSIVIIQGWISQGAARRAAGGQQVTCGGTSGTLPNGACTEASVIVANNGPSAGSGTLVPGAATFELELTQVVGAVTTILDTKTIPITLVANTPSIVSISLASTTLVIDGARVNYTAIVYNPTGASLSNVFVQGLIEQGTAFKGAGGAVLGCVVTSGEMPPGSCVVSFTVGASNAGGVGTLVAGAATFRLELRQGSALLDAKTVEVTLIDP